MGGQAMTTNDSTHRAAGKACVAPLPLNTWRVRPTR